MTPTDRQPPGCGCAGSIRHARKSHIGKLLANFRLQLPRGSLKESRDFALGFLLLAGHGNSRRYLKMTS
jgi:hypothetical protein